GVDDRRLRSSGLQGMHFVDGTRPTLGFALGGIGGVKVVVKSENIGAQLGSDRYEISLGKFVQETPIGGIAEGIFSRTSVATRIEILVWQLEMLLVRLSKQVAVLVNGIVDAPDVEIFGGGTGIFESDCPEWTYLGD